MSKNRSSSICFIALRAYPLLSGKYYEDVKGPNVRQVILARELKKKGFKINFICYDNQGQDELEFIDGICIFKISECKIRPSFLKKFIDALKILSLILKADNDIYIHNGGFLGVLPLLARKKNILMIASDAFINKKIINKRIKGFSKSRFDLDNIGTYLSIKLADSVVVQNENQKKLLKKNFGVEGKYIRNPIPLKEMHEISNKSDPATVLWVGSLSEVKQPELFVELAKTVPEAKFIMIGGKSGSKELYDIMISSSNYLKNFEYLGVVPFEEIDHYYREAALLVNTSLFEGFPNSFLQAWMNYMPVVSLTVNPDNILGKYSMGLHSKNIKSLKEDVVMLLDNADLRAEMGSKGRKYVEKKHNVSIIVQDFIDLLYSI